MNRREFIRRFVIVTALVGTSAAGITELVSLVQANKSSQGSQLSAINLPSPTTSSATETSATTVSSQQRQTSTTSFSAAPAGYVYIAPLSALAGKNYAYFNHPSYGSSILVNTTGQWKAFSAICTHRPCTVNLSGSSIYCPCHGASFDASNGGVLGGPAPTALAEYEVQIISGNVYVSENRIN